MSSLVYTSDKCRVHPNEQVFASLVEMNNFVACSRLSFGVLEFKVFG